MIYITLHTSGTKVKRQRRNDKSSKYLLHNFTEIHQLMWILKISINIQYKCFSFVLFIYSAKLWGTLYMKAECEQKQNSRPSGFTC